MTASRWLLLAVLAALAGAGALFHALHAPDENPPAQPAPVAALPLVLPAAVPSGASAVAPKAQPATAAATPATASSPRIGSEGYGPHIERAQAGNDAAEAWEAVRWLRLCASNEIRRNSFETVRNQGISPEMMTQLMVEADADERRCQTVTARHRALLPELAARAMRGGVPEAASAYAGAVFPGDLTPAQRQEVADAMRRDALSGHSLGLLGAIMANEAWGLSDTERLAFLMAYGELPDHPETKAMAKVLVEQHLVHFKDTPTPEQQAAAKLAAQQILDRLRAGS